MRKVCEEAYAGKALFLVRNSQSSRVKMSFVTAAIEKRVRSLLQRASMRAVLPEPTGLVESVVCLNPSNDLCPHCWTASMLCD